MSKIQLYIGTDLLDFNERVNVKRQVNDYRNPAVGGNVTSYTLKIPLTRKNRPLLGFIDDVRSRAEVTEQARLIADGMEIIRGKMRILRANSDRCTVIIEGNDWVADIAGISIKDLSWAGGDEHIFTSANIEGSWTAAVGAFYRYPLINFAELVSGDTGSGGSTVYPYDFYMAWNIQDIVTKMLLDAGYTLEGSGFFATTFGRALYILGAGRPVENDFISGKNLKVYVTNDTDNQDSALIGGGGSEGLSLAQTLDFNSEDEDEGEDFNIGTGRYTVPVTGTYRFQNEVDIFCTFNRVGGSWTPTANSVEVSIRKNGTTDIEKVTNNNITALDSGNNVYSLDTGFVHLEAGDTIETYIDIQASGTNDTGGALTAFLFITNGINTSYMQNVWSEQNLWPGIGRTISPSEYLPDMDSVELLKALKEAFNLRFWVDRNNKTVYAETSNDFYGSTVIDWSDKIDYSRSPELEVLASNYKKNQKFRWLPASGDNAYTNFVSANGIPFEKHLVLDSEYVKAGTDERVNPVFAPTITGVMAQIGHQEVPRIFGSAEFVSSSRPYPAFRAKNWEPRIMEWKGLVAMPNGQFNYYDEISDTTPVNYTTFPSMETPDMNDMFDEYFLKDWSRIENNKIVPCTLKLTPSEIMKFMTVVGTAANEGFRATYKVNIEGIDMYYLVASIVTDGDRVKAELIQKL